MTASLEDLISQPEPWWLDKLHLVKVYIGIGLLPSLALIIAGAVLGIASIAWLYAFLALLAVGSLIAFVANKCSEAIFVRRAKTLGLDGGEARSFYQTYDWDQDSA